MTPEVRDYLSRIGSKGGKAVSREAARIRSEKAVAAKKKKREAKKDVDVP